MYQNFTARFNTYYNAKKLFDDAVVELTRTPPAGRDTNYFVMQTVKNDGQSKFDKVIEKCSKILQNYTESNLVDNAILMIGESFVYMGEYEGAIRKFKELLENFPESDKRLEAKLWYAKAEYYNSKPDEAIRLVEELVPEAKGMGEDNIALEAIMLEAQIYFNRGEYGSAVEQYDKAVTIDGSKPMLTAAYLQLALSYQRMLDYKKAGDTYAALLKLRPEPSIRYRATMQFGKMNTLLKNYDVALQTFNDLKGDVFKKEDLAQVEVEIANTYNARGDTATAFPMYNRIDTVFRRTDASARSYYQQGLYSENILLDYKKAYDYYSKAQGEFLASEITPTAKLKSDRFMTYFRLINNISNYDSLLWAAFHPDTTKKQGDTSRVNKDSSTVGGFVPARLDSSKQHFDSTAHNMVEDEELAQQPSDTMASIPKTRPANSSQYLSHRGRGHNRDEDDDIESDTSVNKGDIQDFSHQLRQGKNTSNKQDDVSRNVSRMRTATLTPDSLRFLITQSKFELGGLFMLELNEQDSAQLYYEQVIREDSTTRFIPRALYALAEIHRAKNDSGTVDSLYQRILKDYEKTEYARQIKRLMGGGQEISEVDSAEIQYKAAENLLTTGKTNEALKMFKRISHQNSSSPIMPKTQYVVGWIYENIVFDNDSAAQWYCLLIQMYPTSIYAMNAQPKVAVKEHPDSLSQYLNIKEIPLVAKQGTSRRSREAISEKEGKQDQVSPQSHRKRGNEEVDEEQDDTQEEQSDDSSDDDNN